MVLGIESRSRKQVSRKEDMLPTIDHSLPQ